MTIGEATAEMRLLLDDLEARGLTERIQIVSCCGLSLQLGPKPYTTPVLAPGEAPPEKETQPTLTDLTFAASEGMGDE